MTSDIIGREFISGQTGHIVCVLAVEDSKWAPSGHSVTVQGGAYKDYAEVDRGVFDRCIADGRLVEIAFPSDTDVDRWLRIASYEWYESPAGDSV